MAGALVLALATCGSAGNEGKDGQLSVQAAFYPLQWVASQVGGDLVDVADLTRPGAEPHDLELKPKDVAAVTDADVVIYLSDFQPAVDDAVRRTSGPTVFDAAEAGRLTLTLGDGGRDPHFWLDPTRLASVATAFGDTLGERDPEHAGTYRENARRVSDQLDRLDRDVTTGLADCRSRDLVTSHQAFGYLADRYRLDQIGIAGLSPAQEPSATDLAEVTRFVKANDVRTIYVETLVSPAVAKTVADEAGVATAVLDPLEGLTDSSPGSDYLEVMRANLATLRAGQGCT